MRVAAERAVRVTLSALPDMCETTSARGFDPIDRQERFETMFRQTERLLLGYALRRAPRETAQDAVAETYLAAWRRFEQLPADPLPWLVATTRRTLANQRRSVARQDLLAERLAHEQPAWATDAGSDPDALVIRQAFVLLPAADREVLALVAWDGLTPTQAARSLGCTAVALRVRLHRARRRLARALATVEEADAHENDERQSRPKPAAAKEAAR